MGNLTSRRRSAATTTQESPRSLLNEETTRGEDKGNGSKRSSFEAVDAARGMSPPDMVAVQIRYSHNLRRLFTEGNLQRLLVNLYEGMKNFQWTLCANIQESSDSPSASEAPSLTGTNCFCSTYPIRDGAEWPLGVKEQTDTVMIDLWMQMGGIHCVRFKGTKEAADEREKVKDYVAKAVGSWISGPSNSCRVWVMTRYSSPVGSGAIEKVAGIGYENGKVSSSTASVPTHKES